MEAQPAPIPGGPPHLGSAGEACSLRPAAAGQSLQHGEMKTRAGQARGAWEPDSLKPLLAVCVLQASVPHLENERDKHPDSPRLEKGHGKDT